MAKNDKPAAKGRGGSGATAKRLTSGAASIQEPAGAQEASGASERPGQSAERADAAPGGPAKGTTASTPGLAVTSMRDGFWRAGMSWTKATTVVPLASFTEQQVKQLDAEPMLNVVRVDVPLPQEGA